MHMHDDMTECSYIMNHDIFLTVANSSLRSHPEGIVPDNDIRQWENGSEAHTLAAVEALDS